MANISPYSVGQRWYCDLTNTGRESFTFVIIGPGSKPGEKKCRLEFDNHNVLEHGREQVYSHKHLKKYAKHVEA